MGIHFPSGSSIRSMTQHKDYHTTLHRLRGPKLAGISAQAACLQALSLPCTFRWLIVLYSSSYTNKCKPRRDIFAIYSPAVCKKITNHQFFKSVQQQVRLSFDSFLSLISFQSGVEEASIQYDLIYLRRQEKRWFLLKLTTWKEVLSRVDVNSQCQKNALNW